MTIFGIGGCMALLLVGFGLKDSIMSIAQLQYENLQTYNGSVYLNDEMKDDARKEMETYLKTEKGISEFTSVHMKSATVKKKSKEMDVYLVAIEDMKNVDDFLIFKNRTTGKKYQLNDDGVILTEKAAKKLGAKAGDTPGCQFQGKRKAGKCNGGL